MWHPYGHVTTGLLICLLNYISCSSRLESPLSLRAIDTLALPRLTRGFVCCGQHSRLSPVGIYYLLCFNIHSVWVEINFSFGPNCLSTVAAQGSPAPSLGSGPPHPPHSCILYLITHVLGPQRETIWGFGDLFCKDRLQELAAGISGGDLVVLAVTVWLRFTDPDSLCLWYFTSLLNSERSWRA